MTHSLPVSISDADIEEFGRELDAIQHEVKASLGAADRAYIRRAITVQRSMALGGRVLIYASLPLMPVFPLFLGVIGLGTASLGLSKILENMEIGHNVIHGQWDWMQDPEIHSSTWEWDNVCPADQWKHSHNVVHHTWTNVIGKDRDVGYEILRVTDQQPWRPIHLAQPFYNALLAMLFQWGVAMHDIDLTRVRKGELKFRDIRVQLAGIGKKARKQVLKDYVLWPLLAGPAFLPVLLGNAVANLMRNVWSYAIIFCGHFPDGTQEFSIEETEDESRGMWYFRQILGSANLTGGKLFHLLSGNLSFQIEHHLFPDIPAFRHTEIADEVQEICQRYGLDYNTGPLGRQLFSVAKKICRMALPDRIIPGTRPEGRVTEDALAA